MFERKELSVHCQKHPRYRAARKPVTKCLTCHLLYIIRWQHSKEVTDHLGGVDPFQFVFSGYEQLKEACEGLEVFDK